MGANSEQRGGETADSSDERLEPLNARQQTVYRAQLDRFEEYLRTEGKNPTKELGYADGSISTRLSRFHRAVSWIWSSEEVTTEFAPEHADRVVAALNSDALRRGDGDRFSEGSKRKFTDVLGNWFEFRGIDWEPEINFSDETATDHADPFTKRDLRQLWQAALDYKTVPSYDNLSPEERDRWKGHLAQELGKPKEDIRPADWDTLNNDWKVPSLIRTTREAGWRPALIERMPVDWYDDTAQKIVIPAGSAVKNDAAWEQELSDESAMSLDKWLEQRKNDERYDDRPEIWLNREGNPYESGSLNRLLRNIMDDAGISRRGRKLVWYSFRHSVGTYVYEEYTDLKIVADVLRQKSTASAERYVHPTKELRREAADIM
jgi:hypothetical protein